MHEIHLFHYVLSEALISSKMFISWVPCSLVAGIISHWMIFVRGEHHLQAARLLLLYLVVAGSLFLVDLRKNKASVDHAAMSSISIVGAYALGLFASMATYRLFFHRLRHFPGPYLAKLTKLWHTWHVLDGKQYLLLDALHKQYGDFVRTGKHEDVRFGSL